MNNNAFYRIKLKPILYIIYKMRTPYYYYCNFAVFGLLLMGGVFLGCFSNVEAELSPISMALSFITETDLTKQKIIFNSTGPIHLTIEQSFTLLNICRERSPEKKPRLPVSIQEMSRYAVVLNKIDDEIILRSRLYNGRSRPFLVTVYYADKYGRPDKRGPNFQS